MPTKLKIIGLLPICVSSSPGKLRVGGGMEIDTVYGVYKVHLGPTDSGEYLEVTCRYPRITIGLPQDNYRFTPG